MNAAADTADTLGECDLARRVREELAGYQRSERRRSSRECYARLEEVVRGDPAMTAKQIIDSLRREFGMSRPYFLASYPRCRKVIQTAERRGRDAEELCGHSGASLSCRPPRRSQRRSRGGEPPKTSVAKAPPCPVARGTRAVAGDHLDDVRVVSVPVRCRVVDGSLTGR